MPMVNAGQTSNFVVSYDSTLGNGLAIAQSVLASCEGDLATLSRLFGGIMPPAASLPFQILLVPGGGGAGHPGCASTAISVYCNANTDPLGVPAIVVAEEAEVFMAVQNLGVNCGYSNGEALSRVMATVLYPTRRWLFSTGNSWLNSSNPARPDWISGTDPSDQHFVSIGCGSLFLNYLAYQLNYSWQEIIAAAAPTLAGVAANLGTPNAFTAFAALLQQYFPANVVQNLPDDDPFPLGRPDLYMRHNLADDGTSQTGSLADSPDIIVKNAVVVNPQATYSTAASIASDTESDANVIDGQDNYVYLRVWNRGIDAPNSTATVYWSPPSTLVTPAMWNLIGSAPFADVPPGQLVQLSDPGVTWPAANIPAPGHYCFVATVGNAAQPAPAPGAFASFDDYVNYIFTHNDITWRNFNVAAMGMHQHKFGDWHAFPFRITGAWDKQRAFTLETVGALPEGSRMAIQLAHSIGSRFKPAPAKPEEHEDAKTDPKNTRRLRIHLQPRGRHSLGEIELEPKLAAASHLLIHLPSERHMRPHDVSVRQLYKGREIGRITWRLVQASAKASSERRG